MSDQKNIDRLFQEKLESLEQSPRPEMWLQIEERLAKKKKRRFPIWWIYSGAAVLLLGFLLIPLLENKKEDPDPFRTTDPDITVSPKEKTDKENSKKIPEEKEKTSPLIEKKTPSLPDSKTESILIAEKQNNDDKKSIKKNTINNEVFGKERLRTEVEFTALLSFPADEFDAMSFKTSALNSHVKAKKEQTLASLLDVVQQQDSAAEENSMKKRWAVLPSYGYSRAASFSNTSSIDRSLQDNPVSGDYNSAVGINVSYKIADKWVVRSGVYSQQMSYTTRDVGIVSGVVSSGLNSVNQNTGITNSTGFGANGSVFIGSSGDAQSIANGLTSATLVSNDAELQQVYGYTEVPLEVTYLLKTQSELTIGIVSGFSTLFLNKNEVQVKSPQFSSVLGQANNLNSVNFSANFGLDLDYAITQQWLFNLNPMFKAHLNTFSSNSNGFQPYFLGVYAGIKYQF